MNKNIFLVIMKLKIQYLNFFEFALFRIEQKFHHPHAILCTLLSAHFSINLNSKLIFEVLLHEMQ